jgi:hypothetical protein
MKWKIVNFKKHYYDMIGRIILLAWICLLNVGISSSFGQPIRLDHVILAVPNLDSATAHYSRLGFKIKPGMLHANGLKNAHIKFANGSELELMTVEGTPGDSLAMLYKHFIDNQQTGAFVAFAGILLDQLSYQLHQVGIQHNLATNRLWNYLTFPVNSALAPLFFIEYKQEVSTNPVYFKHTNRAYAIDQIQIESNDQIQNLFKLLEVPSQPSSTQGLPVYLTPTGNVAMYPSKSYERPQIKSVQFLHEANWDIIKITFPN